MYWFVLLLPWATVASWALFHTELLFFNFRWGTVGWDEETQRSCLIVFWVNSVSFAFWANESKVSFTTRISQFTDGGRRCCTVFKQWKESFHWKLKIKSNSRKHLFPQRPWSSPLGERQSREREEGAERLAVIALAWFPSLAYRLALTRHYEVNRATCCWVESFRVCNNILGIIHGLNI